ncbi:MAG: hypothetical protein AB7I36_01985 [Rhodospirillaceae bacterium]
MSYALVDTNTRESLALLVDLDLALKTAAFLSRLTRRPLSVIESTRALGKSDMTPPVARFIDGEQIIPTARVLPLDSPPKK